MEAGVSRARRRALSLGRLRGKSEKREERVKKISRDNGVGSPPLLWKTSKVEQLLQQNGRHQPQLFEDQLTEQPKSNSDEADLVVSSAASHRLNGEAKTKAGRAEMATNGEAKTNGVRAELAMAGRTEGGGETTAGQQGASSAVVAETGKDGLRQRKPSRTERSRTDSGGTEAGDGTGGTEAAGETRRQRKYSRTEVGADKEQIRSSIGTL